MKTLPELLLDVQNLREFITTLNESFRLKFRDHELELDLCEKVISAYESDTDPDRLHLIRVIVNEACEEAKQTLKKLAGTDSINENIKTTY